MENQNNTMAFNEWLKIERQKKGLTASEFANKCGLSRISISQFETGKAVPGIKAVKKIADVIGCDIAFIVTLINRNNNNNN